MVKMAVALCVVTVVTEWPASSDVTLLPCEKKKLKQCLDVRRVLICMSVLLRIR